MEKEKTRKEKPIIFSTEMVEAILSGKKTQTRRPIKGVPSSFRHDGICIEGACAKHKGLAVFSPGINSEHCITGCVRVRPPYLAGDRMWVRETFAEAANGRYVYKTGMKEFDTWKIKWTPSIHMPRAASRILLDVKSVKIERLHNITEDDAKSEGVRQYRSLNLDLSYRDGFANTWDKIYVKGDYGWAANPWVWVVEFERV